MKIISMLKLKKWSLEGAKLMAVFSIDLPGRVKNFELPRTKPLMPLFETIVNSIYAIEERQQNDDKVNGYINIEIIREPQMRVQTEGIDSSINDITGFVVTDNGIGFDENNMKSFLQSDSTYRAEKGGKGVGRFAWLKAFKEADIESSFIEKLSEILQYIQENTGIIGFTIAEYLPFDEYRLHKMFSKIGLFSE